MSKSLVAWAKSERYEAGITVPSVGCDENILLLKPLRSVFLPSKSAYKHF